ncbi:MAG TPA: hypothetical protein VF756_28165 [Thermoanaerobaculia bacterium]
MKRLLLVALTAWGVVTLTPAQADPPTNCAAVLCQPCPEGFRLLLKPNNCCRCVPIPPSGPLS